MKITIGFAPSTVRATQPAGASGAYTPKKLNFDENAVCNAFLDYFCKANLITESECAYMKRIIDEEGPKATA